MQYLKKSTVKTVIELASACPPDHEFTADEIRAGIMGQLETDPQTKAYTAFLTNLGEAERAELTALLRLGRELDQDPAEFSRLVDHALEDGSRDLFDERKQKLPQYLRHGMERLARYQSKKRTSMVDENKRRALIGKYVIEQYEKTYGREHGWHRLLSLMMDQGYLDRPEDRRLFNLPEENGRHALDEVLGKRDSGRIKLEPLK